MYDLDPFGPDYIYISATMIVLFPLPFESYFHISKYTHIKTFLRPTEEKAIWIQWKVVLEMQLCYSLSWKKLKANTMEGLSGTSLQIYELD